MTYPTQDEHAQTEALRLAKIIRDWCSDCRIPLPSDDECARLVAALTATPAQPAAPQGVAYAELPTHSHAGRVYEEGFLIGTCKLYTADKMRAFADATHALRAPHGQAPAGAGEAAEHYRNAIARACEGWIALPGALPEPGVPVLLDIGKKYPIRALWAAKHTVEAADDDTDWAEYDEATETYYCPVGWYEWNEHEEIHWAVTETPRAWAPLPPTTSAGSGKVE